MDADGTMGYVLCVGGISRSDSRGTVVTTLLPFTFWAQKRFTGWQMSRVFVYGAALYACAALVVEAIFDHLGPDSLWVLCLALPVGGVTSTTYAWLRRKGPVDVVR